MALSDFAIRKAKPKEKPYRMADGDGLHLLVQPHGSKSWQMRYRFRGKENVLSFGRYPIVTLAEAREKKNAARKLLSNGIDPAVQRKLDRIEAEHAARQTFGLIADEYLERMKATGAAEATLTKT